MKPEIIKKPSYRKSYGLNSQGDFTPYYFKNKGKMFFIRNLVTGITDLYKKDKRQRDEMAKVLRNLRENNYKFICFYCGQFTNPFDFIKWVQQKGYTFEIHGELFLQSDNEFTDFHGNLTTYSHSFMFRIYDHKLLGKLKELVKPMKKHYSFKRDKAA